MPQQLDDAGPALLNYLTIDEDKVHSIGSNTRDQAVSGQWKKKCTYRFTAVPYESQTIFIKTCGPCNQTLLFSRRTPMAVLKSGLVSKSYPVVGATPDAKIVDYGCSICFSLGQVKCPHKVECHPTGGMF